MKLHRSKQTRLAMTRLEFLVVTFVLMILVVMILPTLMKSRGRGGHINCANNVKQVGLAFRIWAGDHGDKLPMEVSIVNGGVKESVAAGNAAAVFQVMSNELHDPRILHCPRDTERSIFPLAPGRRLIGSMATNFSGNLKNHISYFVGLDASANQPDTFLSGDDNFKIGGVPAKPGLLEISKNSSIAWTAARHTTDNRYFWNVTMSYGNVCLADGSVQQTTISSRTNSVERSTGTITTSLTELLQATGLATNRLVIP